VGGDLYTDLEQRKKLYNALRKRLQRCKSINEDVMLKYYGKEMNKCRPILLDEEVNLDGIRNASSEELRNTLYQQYSKLTRQAIRNVVNP